MRPHVWWSPILLVCVCGAVFGHSGVCVCGATRLLVVASDCMTQYMQGRHTGTTYAESAGKRYLESEVDN